MRSPAPAPTRRRAIAIPSTCWARARARALDARRYLAAYAAAIEAIGKAAGNKPLPDRMGISVKLSALHPRYVATHREQVLEELVPDLLDLAQKAKALRSQFHGGRGGSRPAGTVA